MNNYFQPQIPMAGGTYRPVIPQSPVDGFIKVNGIDEAINYYLPPNSSMPLFDANDNILYIKTTDKDAHPTIRKFLLEEIVDDPEKTNLGTRLASQKDIDDVKIGDVKIEISENLKNEMKIEISENLKNEIRSEIKQICTNCCKM